MFDSYLFHFISVASGKSSLKLMLEITRVAGQVIMYFLCCPKIHLGTAETKRTALGSISRSEVNFRLVNNLFLYRAQFEGNLLRFASARTHVRAMMTRKPCAVEIHNAILRNYLNFYFQSWGCLVEINLVGSLDTIRHSTGMNLDCVFFFAEPEQKRSIFPFGAHTGV